MGACDGGCSVKGGLPCEHAEVAVRKLGVTLESLMNPADTTLTWRAQYSGSIELPSSAEMETFAHLDNPRLRMPPALARPKGRPSGHKRKQSVIEKIARKKRKITCSTCRLIGHNCVHCPDTHLYQLL